MTAVILCADDFGLTEAVSAAIVELALHRRLSATSAMVTTSAWSRSAAYLTNDLRARIAVGLHINLTLGQPLTKMPRFAPHGTFPGIDRLVRRSMLRHLDAAELRGEIAAQIARFEADVGTLPDVLDGHQHVHALPVVRQALVDALADFAWSQPPLIRSPSDTFMNICRRRWDIGKAVGIAALTAGFRREIMRRRLPTNDTFAGASSFSRRRPYNEELRAAMISPGRCHLVMCHPGRIDEALRRLDSVVERREDEYEALMSNAELPERILHPLRSSANGTIDWMTLCGVDQRS
ncbi:MAG: ChbG/HpnK family deacetylase [Hyphomicrobiaceae bacterium]